MDPPLKTGYRAKFDSSRFSNVEADKHRINI